MIQDMPQVDYDHLVAGPRHPTLVRYKKKSVPFTLWGNVLEVFITKKKEVLTIVALINIKLYFSQKYNRV